MKVDVRFLLPPLINLIAMLLLPQHQAKGSTTTTATAGLFQNFQYPILTFVFLFISISISFILFLCTPIEIQLTASPLHFRFGYFSCGLAIAMVASLSFPTQIFWIAFLLIILTIRFHGTFQSIYNTLLQRLQSLPALIVSFLTHPQPPPPSPPSDHQLSVQSITAADNQPLPSAEEAV